MFLSMLNVYNFFFKSVLVPVFFLIRQKACHVTEKMQKRKPLYPEDCPVDENLLTFTKI